MPTARIASARRTMEILRFMSGAIRIGEKTMADKVEHFPLATLETRRAVGVRIAEQSQDLRRGEIENDQGRDGDGGMKTVGGPKLPLAHAARQQLGQCCAARN